MPAVCQSVIYNDFTFIWWQPFHCTAKSQQRSLQTTPLTTDLTESLLFIDRNLIGLRNVYAWKLMYYDLCVTLRVFVNRLFGQPQPSSSPRIRGVAKVFLSLGQQTPNLLTMALFSRLLHVTCFLLVRRKHFIYTRLYISFGGLTLTNDSMSAQKHLHVCSNLYALQHKCAVVNETCYASCSHSHFDMFSFELATIAVVYCVVAV